MIRKTIYLNNQERKTVDLTCRVTLRRRKNRVRRLLGFLFRNRRA